MKDRIKIQHYVPRFYLRNFSIKQGTEYVTNCFDKPEQKSFLVSIKKVAAEKYFYDTSKSENQIIEESLGKFESNINTVYTQVVKKESLSFISRRGKMSFACFIAAQEIRTREFRELIRDCIRQLTKRLSKERLSKEFKKKLKGIGTDEFFRTMQIRILINNIPTLATILFNLKWVLLVNRTNSPYWTSDHPVNRYNPIDLGPYGNLGLLSSGIQIYFPLSSNISLGLYDPSMYYYLPEKYEITNKQNIIFQNHLQVHMVH